MKVKEAIELCENYIATNNYLIFSLKEMRELEDLSIDNIDDIYLSFGQLINSIEEVHRVSDKLITFFYLLKKTLGDGCCELEDCSCYFDVPIVCEEERTYSDSEESEYVDLSEEDFLPLDDAELTIPSLLDDNIEVYSAWNILPMECDCCGQVNCQNRKVI
jgi:hypothetical protein